MRDDPFPEVDDRDARLRAAEWVTTRLSEATVRDLANDSFAVIRAAIAANSTQPLPDDVVTALIDDPDRSVRQALITARSDDVRVTSAVLTHPDPAARIDLSIWASNLPGPVAAALACDPEPRVRRAVARDHVRAIPLNEVMTLARDPVPAIRRVLADQPGLPDVVVEGLARDGDAGVRRRAAAYADRLPEPVLVDLAGDPDPTVRYAVLRALVDAVTSGTIARVPSPVVDRAAADRAPRARSLFLASLPSIVGPRTRWSALVADPDVPEGWKVAVVTATRSSRLIRKAAGHESAQVRAAAAGNPRVDVDTLTVLADDLSPVVRAAAQARIVAAVSPARP